MDARTPQRAYLEMELLPRFAARFPADALVLNVGAGRHGYREYFRCPIRTADKAQTEGVDEVWPAEAIPYPDRAVDGIVLNGVFDRLDDPMQAMRECHRVLKPAGAMLFGAGGVAFPWHTERERWVLTPGGARWVTSKFRVLEERIDPTYCFLVLQP